MIWAMLTFFVGWLTGALIAGHITSRKTSKAIRSSFKWPKAE